MKLSFFLGELVISWDRLINMSCDSWACGKCFCSQQNSAVLWSYLLKIVRESLVMVPNAPPQSSEDSCPIPILASAVLFL